MVKPIKQVRQVMFFNEKSKKLWVEIQGNLSHFRCLACWVVEFDYKCPFLKYRLITMEMTIPGTF